MSLCCACGRRSRLVTASKQLWQHVAGNDGSHRIPPLYLVILTSMEAMEILTEETAEGYEVAADEYGVEVEGGD